MPTRVILADDHLILRNGLKTLIEPAGFLVVGEASDGHEAVRLARALKPDIAVLDVSMPVLNGIDAAREIHGVSPATRTVMLSMQTDPAYLVASLRAGVRGYVVKTAATSDLLGALEDVLRGHVYVSPSLSDALTEATVQAESQIAPDVLTLRERRVLQLLSEGKTTKEIATILSLTAASVEAHRAEITRKLGITNTAGLVRYAVRNGLTQI
jgi:DNA-binding NarL/FixJ family response regulator